MNMALTSRRIHSRAMRVNQRGLILVNNRAVGRLILGIHHLHRRLVLVHRHHFRGLALRSGRLRCHVVHRCGISESLPLRRHLHRVSLGRRLTGRLGRVRIETDRLLVPVRRRRLRLVSNGLDCGRSWCALRYVVGCTDFCHVRLILIFKKLHVCSFSRPK